MFEENRALRRATGSRWRWNMWDVSSEFRAKEAARAGWFVAGWQAVWMVISVVFGGALLATAGGLASSTGPLAVLSIGLALAALLAGLGWVIRQHQPRWASLLLLVYMALLLLAGSRGVLGIGQYINLVLTVFTVLSVRGAFAAARFRRDAAANPATAAQTFD